MGFIPWAFLFVASWILLDDIGRVSCGRNITGCTLEICPKQKSPAKKINGALSYVYRAAIFFGSPARTWTADLVVNSHSLCRLSYWGKKSPTRHPINDGFLITGYTAWCQLILSRFWRGKNCTIQVFLNFFRFGVGIVLWGNAMKRLIPDPPWYKTALD